MKQQAKSTLLIKTQKPDKLPVVLTGIVIALVYLLVFVAEQVVPSSSMLFLVLKKGAAYALVAVSMNLLNGFTGLFSLGQAGFMLIGAYTYCIFTIPVANRAAVYQYYDGGLLSFSTPVFVGLLLAGVAAGIFAWLIGLPVLRLKSDYLAIATLGFAEIIRAIFQWGKLGPITNGSNVLRNFPTFNSFNIQGADGTTTVYLSTLVAFLIAGVCIALIVLFVNSTYGRAFKAIRDDEVAAEAMGIQLARHKMLSFVVSSFFAGIGGGMLAMYMSSVQAKNFTANMTYEILLIVVIGGIGSITGSILSSFLFVASSEWWLRFLDNEMYLTAAGKIQFVAGFVTVLIIITALVYLRNRKAPEKKRKRIFLTVGVCDLLLVGWAIWFLAAGGYQMPLLRTGFRPVVFAVAIMTVVLFFSRGIMGSKELPDLFRKRPSRFDLIFSIIIIAFALIIHILAGQLSLTFACTAVLLAIHRILRKKRAAALAIASEGGDDHV